MWSDCASTCAFCEPIEPKPTTAIFTVSLGARWPRPSTRRGTIKGALNATTVPRSFAGACDEFAAGQVFRCRHGDAPLAVSDRILSIVML